MTSSLPKKPLGQKSYGSIAHLPTSRLGPGDHHCHEGQARICTTKARDRHDRIIVQEKLDGSNVGVACIGDEILALGRSGYLAQSSPYRQHQLFAAWVRKHEARFRALLVDGERACGEWLALAHGTKYLLPHEPFVIFDLMRAGYRAPHDQVTARIADAGFIGPRLIHDGSPLAIEHAASLLEPSGHGALEPVEGAVWRVERRGEVDFLAKWVRPDKVDGCYLETELWNVDPSTIVGEN